MSENDNNSQGQKPKTSKLAILSPVLGVIVFAVVFVSALFGDLVGLLIGVAGIILGIVVLVRIHRSRGLLKGKILAICGILTSIAGYILGIYLASVIIYAGLYRITCGRNMEGLRKAIEFYSIENDGEYPTPDKWCDLLMEHADVVERVFKCMGNKEEKSSYAINPNCKPNSPNDVVLLFETKGGWNQFGGKELLSFDNHKGKGCIILFNDGSVNFIKPEDVNALKWTNEQKQ